MNLEDPSIIAALIGVGAGTFGGIAGWIGSRVLTKDTVADRNLEARLEGWQRYCTQLEARVNSQEKREQERETRDSAKDLRIANLETRILECERDRRDLRLTIDQYQRRQGDLI